MNNTEEKLNKNILENMENLNLENKTNNNEDVAYPESNEVTVEKIEKIVPQEQNDLVKEFEVIGDETEDTEEESYYDLDKKGLLEKLDEALAESDSELVKNRIKKIKEAYSEIANEEYENKLSKFIEDGGIKEDFEPIQDAIDTSFYDKHKKFYQKLTDQRKLKEKTLRENYARKQEIIDDLKKLIESGENLNVVFDKYQEIQVKWRSAGPVPNNLIHTQQQDFQFHVGRFFDLVKISKELRELDLKKNQELKLELVTKAENLITEPSIKRSIEIHKGLQNEWQNIGQVAKEINDEIWDRFKKAGDKLYERKEKHVTELRVKQQNNLNKKRELVSAMEALLSIPKKNHQAWQDADTKAEALMNEWKEIGFGPKKENEQVWQEFRELRKSFFGEKEKHYGELRGVQIDNLKKKIALCEEAEAIQNSLEWDITTEKLKALQNKWKNIGAVPRKNSDQIWNRFRAACNVFFENKRLYVSAKEEELKGNVSVKEQIISKIESFVPGENIDEALTTLTNLQKEFNESEIPTNERTRINGLYQRAINKVLDSFKGNENAGRKYYELKYKLISQTEKGKDQINQEKTRIQEKIKTLETEAGLLDNNIGFFGRSKGSQKMVEEFQQKIAVIKTEIEKLKAQLKVLRSI